MSTGYHCVVGAVSLLLAGENMETDYHYQLAYAAYRARCQEYLAQIPQEIIPAAYVQQPYYSPLVSLIEQKTNPGYRPISSVDDLTTLLDDRRELLRSKIELTMLQIKERKNLSQQLTYSIDLEHNQVANLILDLGDEVHFQTPRVISWQMRQMDLERQRRMEQAACFKDVTMLERDLKESLVEYLAESQKQKLLKEV